MGFTWLDNLLGNKSTKNSTPKSAPKPVEATTPPIAEQGSGGAALKGIHDEIKTKAAEYRVAEATREVLSDIAKAPDLKHVEGADRSAPVIEAGVTLKPSPMAALKSELTGSSVELKHVETADHSAPVIDADLKVKKSLMPQLVGEIKAHAGSDAVDVY